MALVRDRRFIGFAVLLFVALSVAGCGAGDAPPPEGGAPTYLFCFWNLENFFDDQDDHRSNAADKEYDSWFAHDPAALKLKLSHLSEALIQMNHGRGPDIIAVAEVESIRAADLLRQALNERLPDQSLHYEHLLMKELNAGRHIAPAIITRLPVHGDRTRLHGRSQRILEGHVEVNGHDLVIIASHWTSRLTDKDGSHRDRYADQIYGTFRGMYKSNPEVDLIVCGDFNDPPDAPSVVRHLHATGDVEAVRASGAEPQMLDLLATKDPQQFGTHNYHSKWFIFDHLVVSPGLLDARGWSCDPGSVQTVNTLVRPNDRQRRPWRFGSERDQATRGYSDHFPVTVELRAEGR